jgi:hypothetical protein
MRYKKKGAGMPKGAGNGMYMNGGKMYATGGAVPGGTGAAPASFWSSAPDASGQHRKHNFVEVEGMPGLFKSTSGDVYMESGDAGKTAIASTPADYKGRIERERKKKAEEEYRRSGSDVSFKMGSHSGPGPNSAYSADRGVSFIGKPGRVNPKTGEPVSYSDVERYSPEFLKHYNTMQAFGLNDVPVVQKDGSGKVVSRRDIGPGKAPAGDYYVARASQTQNPSGALIDFLNAYAEQKPVYEKRYVEDKKKKQQEQAQKSKTYKQGGRIR